MIQEGAPFPDQVGRTAQIIVGALMTGLIFFSGVSVMSGQGNAGQTTILTYIGVGFFVLNIFLSVFLSRTTTASAVRQIASAKPVDWRGALAPVYSSKCITSNAPLEGAGFFNCIAYILDGHWISLAVVLACLSMMAITFPSQSQFESWAEQVQRDQS